MSDDQIYKIGEKPTEMTHTGDTLKFKAMVLDNMEKPTAMPQLTIWTDS